MTMENRKGSFNGMSQKRCFRVSIIAPGKTKSLGFDTGCDKEIYYEGKKIMIKF